jgi:hypothetical protein
MSIGNAARADSAVVVLSAKSAADTAAATSGWIDVRNYKGDLCFIVQTGAVTGSVAGKIQSATDSGGTGAADIPGATFTSVTQADKVAKLTLPTTVAPFVRYVGTVTTGPVLISVILLAHPGESVQ